MPAGRPRKPTAQHKLEGTIPMRPRGLEPKPGGVPAKPSYLTAEASRFWDRVVPDLVSLGVAAEIDAPALEQMCVWWGEAKRLASMKKRPGQWIYEFATADKQWRYYAARFGLTPSDRAKIEVGSASDHDPAAEFVR